MIEKIAEYTQNEREDPIFTLFDGSKGSSLIKTASYASEVASYIDSLEKENGYLYALVNALTAGEYYGSNRNGDFFPEDALKERHGTFVDHGYVYKHHVNKDPKKSMGKVIFSHFNDHMKRVELVVKLKEDHKDVQKIIRDIGEGKVIKTSMGCFREGTPVILPNGSAKPIEDIQEGDEVRTHLGNIKKVTKLEPRDYKGKLITLKTSGKFTEDLECTEEHPIYIFRKKTFYKTGHHRNRNISLSDGEWVKAKDVKKGDFLVIPKFKDRNNSQKANERAKIAGYYLAEGHTSKYDNGVFFTLGKEDRATEVLPKILSGKVVFRDRTNSQEAVELSIYDEALHKDLNSLCGKYSDKKALSPEIFEWTDEQKKHFISTYIEGDGFYHEGQLYISSCNKDLLLQIQHLAHTIDIRCTLGKNEHKGSSEALVKTDTTEYILRFFADTNNILGDYCTKAVPKKVRDHSGKGGPFKLEDCITYRVEDIDESDFEGPVFNFEVEDDHSYLVYNGYAVHNCRVPYDLCSITKKRAKTRAEYSPYLLNQMNQVLPDGRKVYAINTKPTFFDISIVTIPADPVSSFMSMLGGVEKRASYDKTSEDKSAQITKKLDGDMDWIAEDPKGLIRASQPRMTQEEIEKLSSYPLNESLSTLLGLRVLPLKEDFQKLALYSIGKKDLADELEKRGEVFEINLDTPAEQIDGIGPQWANEKIASVIEENIFDYCLTKPAIINRLIKHASIKDTPSKIPAKDTERSFIKRLLFDEPQVRPEQSGVKNPLIPMTTLGTMYAGYAKLFGNTASASGFTNFVGKNPWVGPLIGGGIAAGLTKVQKDILNDVNNPNFEKTAKSVGPYVGSFLVSAPLTYYSSANAELKARRGQKLDNIEDTVRKHPLPIALLGAAGGGRLLKGMGRSFSKASTSAKAGAGKQASRFADPTKSNNFWKKAEYLDGLEKETINLIFKELTS